MLQVINKAIQTRLHCGIRIGQNFKETDDKSYIEVQVRFGIDSFSIFDRFLTTFQSFWNQKLGPMKHRVAYKK